MAERQRDLEDGVNGSIGRRSPLRNPKVRTPYQKIARTRAERYDTEPFTPRH